MAQPLVELSWLLEKFGFSLEKDPVNQEVRGSLQDSTYTSSYLGVGLVGFSFPTVPRGMPSLPLWAQHLLTDDFEDLAL